MEELEDLIPEIDRDFLREKSHEFSASRVGADVHVVIKNFKVPDAYEPTTTDLLIILPAGYPNANLDMFRTLPDVRLKNGNWPLNADNREVHAGVSWQRWSRHFNLTWRQGVDNLRTFVASVRRELEKGI